jgi:hypothetical protein
MKKMLLMLIVSISLFAWRAPEYLQMAGLMPVDPAQQAAKAKEMQALMAAEQAKLPKVKPRTMEEFGKLQKSGDPQAVQKFIDSRQPPAPRLPADKLMNFFKTGKFE